MAAHFIHSSQPGWLSWLHHPTWGFRLQCGERREGMGSSWCSQSEGTHLLDRASHAATPNFMDWRVGSSCLPGKEGQLEDQRAAQSTTEMTHERAGRQMQCLQTGAYFRRLTRGSTGCRKNIIECWVVFILYLLLLQFLYFNMSITSTIMSILV